LNKNAALTMLFITAAFAGAGFLLEKKFFSKRGSEPKDRVACLAEKYRSYRPPVKLLNPRPERKPLGICRKRIYIVEEGDTLSDIATRFYGDPGKWEKILDANSNILSGPEYMSVGMRLDIPE
jgi:nucleoid-associated protein YgaU